MSKHWSQVDRQNFGKFLRRIQIVLMIHGDTKFRILVENCVVHAESALNRVGTLDKCAADGGDGQQSSATRSHLVRFDLFLAATYLNFFFG